MTVGTSDAPVESRRRQRLSDAERRAQIITGGVQVLAEHGYEQASLARIAQAAGVSKGLVSHYFGDRETLMEQVAVTTVARLREAVAARIDPTADVTEIITTAIGVAAALGRTRAAELRAVDEVVRNLRSPDGRPRLDLRAYDEIYAAQERLFRRGQADGVLRAFDTRIMAVTYQGAIDTMIAYLGTYPECDAEEYARTLADLLLHAIRA